MNYLYIFCILYISQILLFFSGRQTGKFLPKSKMQVHGQGSEISIPDVDVVEPVPHEQDMQSVSPEIDIVDRRSVPSFTPDDVLDFSSVGLSHTAPPQATPAVPVDPELGNFMGASHQEAGIPGQHLEAVPEMPVKLVNHLTYAVFDVLSCNHCLVMLFVYCYAPRLLVGQRVEKVKLMLHQIILLRSKWVQHPMRLK